VARSLPYTLDWRGHRLVHATPSEPEEWHYVLSVTDAEYELGAFRERVGFIGHSHVPGAFESDGARVSYAPAGRPCGAGRPRYLIQTRSVGRRAT